MNNIQHSQHICPHCKGDHDPMNIETCRSNLIYRNEELAIKLEEIKNLKHDLSEALKIVQVSLSRIES